MNVSKKLKALTEKTKPSVVSKPVPVRVENPVPKEICDEKMAYVYEFKHKKGKTMGMPKANDSFLGGYTGLGRMSVQSARSYMQAKAEEEQRRQHEQMKVNESLNAFADVFGKDGDGRG